MSLDIYLINTKQITCKCGEVHEIETDKVVYDGNITHNLTKMAIESGIYNFLWRPEEIGITKAGELIQPLTIAVKLLNKNQKKFEQFDSSNGWGTYKTFVPFVEKYLEACIEFPNAKIEVSR